MSIEVIGNRWASELAIQAGLEMNNGIIGNSIPFLAAALMLAGTVGGLATNSQSAEAANRPKGQAKVSHVTMTLFTDYQCPACKRFDSTLRGIRAKYGNRLKIVLRNYPLPIHKNAMVAARAAEAAALQGKLWPMHDQLYANQAAWIYSNDPIPTFVDFAKQLGLNTNKFAQDIKSSAVSGKVNTDVQAAMAQGVKGTPTAILNGATIAGAPIFKLDGYINDALNKS